MSIACFAQTFDLGLLTFRIVKVKGSLPKNKTAQKMKFAPTLKMKKKVN